MGVRSDHLGDVLIRFPAVGRSHRTTGTLLCHRVNMSLCQCVTMSSQLHVNVSPCHPDYMSVCHNVTQTSYHCVTISSHHHVLSPLNVSLHVICHLLWCSPVGHNTCRSTHLWLFPCIHIHATYTRSYAVTSHTCDIHHR